LQARSRSLSPVRLFRCISEAKSIQRSVPGGPRWTSHHQWRDILLEARHFWIRGIPAAGLRTVTRPPMGIQNFCLCDDHGNKLMSITSGRMDCSRLLDSHRVEDAGSSDAPAPGTARRQLHPFQQLHQLHQLHQRLSSHFNMTHDELRSMFVYASLSVDCCQICILTSVNPRSESCCTSFAQFDLNVIMLSATSIACGRTITVYQCPYLTLKFLVQELAIHLFRPHVAS
jgi:hypothetical protein